MDNSFLIRLGLNADEIAHGLTKATSQLSNFSDQVVDIGKSIGAAFAVERVAEFAFEISELAAKAAGVKAAFSQLPDSVALLEQMNEITHGTVDNLDLMGKAVRAENLGIPLQNLGTYLEFAHVRAIATNQDFNTLADTLLKAIGRGGAGAKKAMAELQISTERYNEALKETGSTGAAVMKIAQEEIEKSKGKMDETLHAIEANKKAWDDLKESAGTTLNESGILHKGLSLITADMHILNSETLSWWEKMMGVAGGAEGVVLKMEKMREKQEAIKKGQKEWNDLVEKWNGVRLQGVDIVSTKIETIRSLEEKIKGLKEDQLDADGKELSSINQQVKALEDKIKLLREQGTAKATPETKGQFALKMSTIGPDTTVQDEMAAKNDTLSKSFEHLAEVTDDWSERATTDFAYVHDAHELISKDFKKMQTQEALTSKLSHDLANDLAGAFTKIIDGSESFSKAIGQMVEQFGQQMLAMALAAIIADAVSPTSSGGNMYVALALAGIGMVAIGALMSKAGVKGGSGASSAGSTIGSRQIDRYNGSYGSMQTVNVTGEFKLQGPNLVAAIKTSNRNASIMGGN